MFFYNYFLHSATSHNFAESVYRASVQLTAVRDYDRNCLSVCLSVYLFVALWDNFNKNRPTPVRFHHTVV